MIIASLCWKNNEWVGLTMACAISELLGELEGILLKLPDSYNTSSLQSYSLGKSCIATDKALFQLKSTYFFLINFICCGTHLFDALLMSTNHKNVCCGYSWEVPHQGFSNEYLQHMVTWINKKINMWIAPYIWSYDKCLCQYQETVHLFLNSFSSLLA